MLQPVSNQFIVNNKGGNDLIGLISGKEGPHKEEELFANELGPLLEDKENALVNPDPSPEPTLLIFPNVQKSMAEDLLDGNSSKVHTETPVDGITTRPDKKGLLMQNLDKATADLKVVRPINDILNDLKSVAIDEKGNTRTIDANHTAIDKSLLRPTNLFSSDKDGNPSLSSLLGSQSSTKSDSAQSATMGQLSPTHSTGLSDFLELPPGITIRNLPQQDKKVSIPHSAGILPISDDSEAFPAPKGAVDTGIGMVAETNQDQAKFHGNYRQGIIDSYRKNEVHSSFLRANKHAGTIAENQVLEPVMGNGSRNSSLANNISPYDKSSRSSKGLNLSNISMMGQDGVLAGKVLNRFMDAGEQMSPASEDLSLLKISPNIGSNHKESSTAMEGELSVPLNNNSQILAEKNANTIEQLRNYILQINHSPSKEVGISFDHKELGRIDLRVMESGDKDLSIHINTSGREGHDFFVENKKNILNSLSDIGLKVGELKIDHSQFSTAQNSLSDEKSSDSNSQHGGSSRDPITQQKNQQERERDSSQRRKELWDELFNNG